MIGLTFEFAPAFKPKSKYEIAEQKTKNIYKCINIQTKEAIELHYDIILYLLLKKSNIKTNRIGYFFFYK